MRVSAAGIIWSLEGPVDVYLSSPRGFCAGVVRAVDIVDIALRRFGAPVYVKHQIVHNPHVVASLEAKGAVTVEDVDQIPEGSNVVFSAHGSAPDDFAKARKRNLRVIDATCPLVTRVHNEAKKYEQGGKRLILVGHRGHQEVRGTMGQANMHLMDDREKAALPDWVARTPVAVLTQTTLSVDDTARVVKTIREQFPDAVVRNDICYATTNRQESAKLVARQVEVVLVIGAQNSSNCRRLQEVAEAEGVPAYLINGPAELDMKWLEGVDRVGITSGASTPEEMVQAVIEAISPAHVIPVGEQEEDIHFVLPRELRDAAAPQKASKAGTTR
jgi:4-hydroxy-3-methylbut-2-enyl diphosphate reductase